MLAYKHKQNEMFKQENKKLKKLMDKYACNI